MLEKNNEDLIARKQGLIEVDITLPSTLNEELKTNPFLRSKNLKQFKERRMKKDNY
jgi:hypothetical protein